MKTKHKELINYLVLMIKNIKKVKMLRNDLDG